MIDAIRQMIGLDARSYLLRVPREEETEGILLLGDPGTGKSQVIQQLLAQIAVRNPPEAVVCYDPAGEFISNYFHPGRDIVLNPLDNRCPYWSPTLEVDYENGNDGATDRHLIAESFFPIGITTPPTRSSSSNQPAASSRECWNSNLTPPALLRC